MCARGKLLIAYSAPNRLYNIGFHRSENLVDYCTFDTETYSLSNIFTMYISCRI